MKTCKHQSVIVTTQYRGVYHGTLIAFSDEPRLAILKSANMVIHWGTTDGVDQLAATGPTEKSKIAAMAPEVRLCGWTSIANCTEEAQQKWAPYKK